MSSIENLNKLMNDKEFYSFDRESLLESKSLQERLSSSYFNFEDFETEEEFFNESIKYITRLAYSLFNFITNEKYPKITLSKENKKQFSPLYSIVFERSASIFISNKN